MLTPLSFYIRTLFSVTKKLLFRYIEKDDTNPQECDNDQSYRMLEHYRNIYKETTMETLIHMYCHDVYFLYDCYDETAKLQGFKITLVKARDCTHSVDCSLFSVVRMQTK